MRACLRQVRGLGSQRLKQLILHFGSAAGAWRAADKEFGPWGNQGWVDELLKGRREIKPNFLDKRLKQLDIKLVLPEEKNYPRLLSQLSDAPPLLYYKGNINGDAEALAVVGARKVTPYGKAAADFLAGQLAEQGIVVASGLASGIDSAAHQGVVRKHGVTWGFLGCGLDRIYPRENKRLAEEITEQGALISEYPPGTPPEAQHFPARNRLISGCARGVLVVEAAQRSGALITADFALEQGREVFAVPGPIFSGQSKGTHQLLRQGAKLVEDFGDIWPEISAWGSGLAWVAPSADSDSSNEKRAQEFKRAEPVIPVQTVGPAKMKSRILDQLSDLPVHVDRLQAELAAEAGEVNLALLELELAGEIVQLPGRHYVLAR